jgi:hypothetical protein
MKPGETPPTGGLVAVVHARLVRLFGYSLVGLMVPQ